MEFKAIQKNTRQSPRKVRLVANQVKKLSLENAIRQLAVIERRATVVLLKTLKQAIANAKNNHNIAVDELMIKEITINEGPRYRRFRAVSRGRAHGVIKRTSHVTVVLQTKPVVQAEPKSVKPQEIAPVEATETKVTKKTAAAPKKAVQKKEK